MLEFVVKYPGGNIHLKSDIHPKYSFNDVYMSRDVDGGELIVAYSNIDRVYHYGLISNREECGHGPGYVWSSRVGVLNLSFGTDFVEVVINGCAGYCMSSKDLIKLMPDGCYFERVESFEDKEPYYCLRGYKNISWFALNNGIHQFNTTEDVEITDDANISVDGFTLKSTNYDGVYVFDTLEFLSNKYPINYSRFRHNEERETGWSTAPSSIKDTFVEVYVNYNYGYCASKEMLKQKFPEHYR